MKFKILIIGILFTLSNCSSCKNATDNKAPLALTLELEGGNKSIFTTTRVVELKLKSENKLGTFKVKELTVTKGELVSYYQKTITTGAEYYSRDGYNYELRFLSNREVGEAVIKMKIINEEGREGEVELKFEIKSFFEVKLTRLRSCIFSGETCGIFLNIKSEDKDLDKEVYIFKKLELTHGELQRENGTILKAGDTFLQEQEKLLFNSEKELDKSAVAKIKLTVANNHGVEETVVTDIQIDAVTFKVDITEINWQGSDRDFDAQLKEFVGFRININSDTAELEKTFGERAWRLTSWKFDDSTSVIMVNHPKEQLKEFPLRRDSWLYFKIEDFDPFTTSTLQLVIEGPLNSKQETSIKITKEEKALIIAKQAAEFLKTIQKTNQELKSVLERDFGYYNDPHYYDQAADLCQDTQNSIDYFNKMMARLNNKNLTKTLKPSTIITFRNINLLIEEIKINKEQVTDLYKV